jgi:serine/threonine protein kinase
MNLVLKDNPINRNARNTDGSSSSSKVSINGGTGCYQAPELFKKNAKFSRRADVFAAGVVFLELLTLQKPNSLCPDGPRTNESNLRHYFYHRKHPRQPFFVPQSLSLQNFLSGALRYSSSHNAQERVHNFYSMLNLDYSPCRYGLRDTKLGNFIYFIYGLLH